MQIGVVFPQTEFGGDVGAVQAYAQGVDDLGFRHLIAYDHVLGADPAVHRDWTHRYTAATTFHTALSDQGKIDIESTGSAVSHS